MKGFSCTLLYRSPRSAEKLLNNGLHSIYAQLLYESIDMNFNDQKRTKRQLLPAEWGRSSYSVLVRYCLLVPSCFMHRN